MNDRNNTAGEERRKRILEMLGLNYNCGKSFMPKKSGHSGAYIGGEVDPKHLRVYARSVYPQADPMLADNDCYCGFLQDWQTNGCQLLD